MTAHVSSCLQCIRWQKRIEKGVALGPLLSVKFLSSPRMQTTTLIRPHPSLRNIGAQYVCAVIQGSLLEEGEWTREGKSQSWLNVSLCFGFHYASVTSWAARNNIKIQQGQRQEVAQSLVLEFHCVMSLTLHPAEFHSKWDLNPGLLCTPNVA